MAFLSISSYVVVVNGFVTTRGGAPPSPPMHLLRPVPTALRAEQQKKKNDGGGIFGAVSNFFEELDAFVDDATARRLGNGAAYYGKRKSSFYGKDDKMKKTDKNVADSDEDYMVSSGGNYKWITDDNGQLRPVSRMKNTSVEKPTEFWGRKEKKKNDE